MKIKINTPLKSDTYKTMTGIEAYRTSHFGKAVRKYMSRYDNFKKPLDVYPQKQKEIKYKDGTSEFKEYTKDLRVKGLKRPALKKV